MRIWLAIVTSVLVVAAGVFYASQTQRHVAEENFSETSTAQSLRALMLEAELALDEALADGDRRAVGEIERVQTQIATTLDALAEDLAADEGAEILAEMRTHFHSWRVRAAPDITALRAGRSRSERGDDRDGPARAFLLADEELRAAMAEEGEAEEEAASRVPVAIVIGLSGLFLLVGGSFARRERRRRRSEEEAEHERRAAERELQDSQRRLSEALQVAADQREAHQILRGHLERAIPGSSVHVLNRNNSADRLEPATALPEGSPLAEALAASEPRSCIAVRLSRPFERGDSTQEVLQCELCGALPTETSCRPLLVGGEVIGSVLVERAGGLDESDARRIDESVTASAPVLANLRNLAIAEMRAATDSLTGLPNRRSLDDALKRMIAQASRAMQPLALVQIDLDHFKQINDTFGHEKGDSVLAGFGALLRSSLRASDFAARFGGEEFVLVLPDTDRQGALLLAEKLRRNVHALRAEGVDRRVTCSMGVAVFPDDAGDDEMLMRLSDRALYASKQNGRDRVETVSEMGRGSTVDAG